MCNMVVSICTAPSYATNRRCHKPHKVPTKIGFVFVFAISLKIVPKLIFKKIYLHVLNLVPGMQLTAFVTILLFSPKLICVYLYCSICEYSYSSNTSFSILTSYACFPCHSPLIFFGGRPTSFFYILKKLCFTLSSPPAFSQH